MDGFFMGQIIWFAGNFAPRNFAFCQGQIVNISSNTALFSILGTTFGGNGTTTFGLPDFQGRVAVGAGQGPGLSAYALGQKAGENLTTIKVENMPAHIHSLNGAAVPGNANTPVGNLIANTGSRSNPDLEYNNTPNVATVKMAPQAIMPSGGGLPFNNEQPGLGMNFVICTHGIFPSRN
ncbi:MAG: tail fiber protein [Haliscomenobacter sp.]|uniref:phage tail protein n=1 Tax=Haliscomenobacter sp. TaxID=2717303 RepID=UPI0029B49D40|nr:tail fiber protein [Haliscomenobacter sp.]MDX2067071.1 tail fiber protein [Haliscomenobacter sp.]